MSDFYHSREPTFLERVIAGITKEELHAYESEAYCPPKPLSIGHSDSHWTYKNLRIISSGDARKLHESLGLKVDDEVRDGALHDALSPCDSCVRSESTPVGIVDGLEVGSSYAPTSAGEVPGLVLRALALLDMNVDSSSGPTSTDHHVEFCTGPSETAIPATHHSPIPIDPSHFLRRSLRIGTRPATRAEAPQPTARSPTAAKASSKAKGKATAKGKARPIKASTSTSGPSKANGKKPRARREVTPGSDEENVCASSQSTGRRPPKRRSSDDDDEYVEHPSTKRQKVEPAAVPAAEKATTTREPRISQDVVDGLVDGEVRGPCPWAGCKYELRGTRHGPLVEHFVTHEEDRSVFKSKKLFKCPACANEIRGSCFAEHVLEKHLGAKWRCLLWDDEGVKCVWKGGRPSRVAQHYVKHVEHLQVLKDARKK